MVWISWREGEGRFRLLRALGVGERQSGLAASRATFGNLSKLRCSQIRAKQNNGWHGNSPLPALNQNSIDLGISPESEKHAVGMTHYGFGVPTRDDVDRIAAQA